MGKSDIILNALLTKHLKDLCVPECKTGSTWTSRSFRQLDLWVMKKSWANPWTVGYEIKTNRSDFLNDNKWQEYLQYCSDFYFVAPSGIVNVEELPKEVGLLVTSQSGRQLYTKRKAVRRNIEIPSSIYRYILMWRVQVINERRKSKTEYWRQWLKEKDKKKELGWNVSTKIRKLVLERINEVEIENHHLKKENGLLSDVKQQLRDMGIQGNEIYSYRVREKIKEIESGLPNGLVNYLDQTIKDLTEVKNRIGIIK